MAFNQQRAKFAPELSYPTAMGDGTYKPFSAALTFNPALIIFDNQSTVSVTISDDGVTDGKTLTTGEAMVLDLRTNKLEPPGELTWSVGTQFYAKSIAGVGPVLISMVYAS